MRKPKSYGKGKIPVINFPILNVPKLRKETECDDYQPKKEYSTKGYQKTKYPLRSYGKRQRISKSYEKPMGYEKVNINIKIKKSFQNFRTL